MLDIALLNISVFLLHNIEQSSISPSPFSGGTSCHIPHIHDLAGDDCGIRGNRIAALVAWIDSSDRKIHTA